MMLRFVKITDNRFLGSGQWAMSYEQICPKLTAHSSRQKGNDSDKIDEH